MKKGIYGIWREIKKKQKDKNVIRKYYIHLMPELSIETHESEFLSCESKKIQKQKIVYK